MATSDQTRELASFSVPSNDGNERMAMQRVLDVVKGFGLSRDRLERLGTAVAEATMNAIEHGNHFNSDLPVDVVVLADATSLRVRIRDHGGGKGIPEAETPDLEAKLAGLQSPRGWGLFLIEHMVDELHREADDRHHTVELVMNRERSPLMPGTVFSLSARHREGTAVFELMGDVNRSAQEPLEKAYGHLDSSTQRVLLNFAATDYINSDGIAVIVGILARAQADGRRLAACGLSDHYVDIFDITRLSDFMTIHADERTALAEI